jgi:hypothetical protein
MEILGGVCLTELQGKRGDMMFDGKNFKAKEVYEKRRFVDSVLFFTDYDLPN